jgi:hypothetical protein
MSDEVTKLVSKAFILIIGLLLVVWSSYYYTYIVDMVMKYVIAALLLGILLKIEWVIKKIKEEHGE